MGKTKSEIEELRERVSVVRDNFRANPEFRWLPTFRSEHPEIPNWKLKNVFHGYSTDQHVTTLLEKHWDKYAPKFK